MPVLGCRKRSVDIFGAARRPVPAAAPLFSRLEAIRRNIFAALVFEDKKYGI